MDVSSYLQTEAAIFKVAKEICELDLEGFLLHLRNSKKRADPNVYAKVIASLDRVEGVAAVLQDVKTVFKREREREVEALASKKGLSSSLDLSKPVTDPRVCPTCKSEGMKQSRNNETGSWSYKCIEDHEWEGMH